MKIVVIVRPGKAKEAVEVLKDGTLTVSLVARPIEGKANKALQKVLAKYFNTALSCVVIEKGKKSRRKTVDIIGL